ncbi:MAG: class I SAM-dependent methyltransferase [Actinomycetota bacterium]
MGCVPQDLFASAVSYYERYRSGYPIAELNALAARAGLHESGRVIDVGCGTGQLAIPLARHASTVIAIDPVADMLTHGRRAAQAAGVDNITWLQGDSRQLAVLVEPGALVAFFAASFHWTDRPTVAQELDGLLAPGGSIVVINDDLGEAEEPDWVHAIAEIRARYLGANPAGTDAHTNPSRNHYDVLRDSPFSSVDPSTWSWTRQLTVEEVVGLQFSYSFSTPALFADRAEAFATDVHDAVIGLHPSGLVTEPFRVEVLVAGRP